MGKPRPKHTAELERRAVQPYNERGTTCAEVAREIGVDPSGLADWVGMICLNISDRERSVLGGQRHLPSGLPVAR